MTIVHVNNSSCSLFTIVQLDIFFSPQDNQLKKTDDAAHLIFIAGECHNALGS